MNRLLAIACFALLALATTTQAMLQPEFRDGAASSIVSSAPDSAGSSSVSLALSCRNNPIDGTDPLGLDPWENDVNYDAKTDQVLVRVMDHKWWQSHFTATFTGKTYWRKATDRERTYWQAMKAGDYAGAKMGAVASGFADLEPARKQAEMIAVAAFIVPLLAPVVIEAATAGPLIARESYDAAGRCIYVKAGPIIEKLAAPFYLGWRYLSDMRARNAAAETARIVRDLASLEMQGRHDLVEGLMKGMSDAPRTAQQLQEINKFATAALQGSRDPRSAAMFANIAEIAAKWYEFSKLRTR